MSNAHTDTATDPAIDITDCAAPASEDPIDDRGEVDAAAEGDAVLVAGDREQRRANAAESSTESAR
jgi:hypothetical protein